MESFEILDIAWKKESLQNSCEILQNSAECVQNDLHGKFCRIFENLIKSVLQRVNSYKKCKQVRLVFSQSFLISFSELLVHGRNCFAVF